MTMAIFGRDREVGATGVEGSMNERERNAGHAGGAGIDAFLGKGTTITGTLAFAGPGRLEGRVDGEVEAQDTLTIGDGAIVNAKIVGTTIVVEGRVTGDVTARQRLELRASARLQGNVTTPSLIVHEGAVLEGQCSMSGSAGAGIEPSEAAATRSLDHTRETAGHIASTLLR